MATQTTLDRNPAMRLERDLERILMDKQRPGARKAQTETSRGAGPERYIWVAGRDGLFAMTPEQLQEWRGTGDSQ